MPGVRLYRIQETTQFFSLPEEQGTASSVRVVCLSLLGGVKLREESLCHSSIRLSWALKMCSVCLGISDKDCSGREEGRGDGGDRRFRAGVICSSEFRVRHLCGPLELWCWRRFLRVPWTARRSNQSILKEISPGCSLEGLDVEAETPILWPPDAKS